MKNPQNACHSVQKNVEYTFFPQLRKKEHASLILRLQLESQRENVPAHLVEVTPRGMIDAASAWYSFRNGLCLCFCLGGESSNSLCLFSLSNFVSPVHQASPWSTLELGVQPVWLT